MTTKELEKKLKISENTCIHCPTLELANKVLSIFNKLGLKWFSGEYYTLNHNWDILKKNTVYYPFDGLFSPLKFAQQNDYKIISAEKFIALHPEGKEFDLENYIPKGDLVGFPKEIIARMLECQEEQGNKRDVSVFEKDRIVGFVWIQTKEGLTFWDEVIRYKNFDLFFEKYPKQGVCSECKECRKQEYQESKTAKYVQVGDNAISSDSTSTQSSVEIEINTNEEDSQKFRVGDKVYDILLKEVGIVQDITYSPNIPYGLSVEFKSGVKSYTINGCYIPEYKNPHLLHYQDDYNYDVIDFNNLPNRQNTKRWRAEMGQRYYYVDMYFGVSSFMEENHITDTKLYNSGNYFQTEKEAQELADIIKKCFQELINQNK